MCHCAMPVTTLSRDRVSDGIVKKLVHDRTRMYLVIWSNVVATHVCREKYALLRCTGGEERSSRCRVDRLYYVVIKPGGREISTWCRFNISWYIAILSLMTLFYHYATSKTRWHDSTDDEFEFVRNYWLLISSFNYVESCQCSVIMWELTIIVVYLWQK